MVGSKKHLARHMEVDLIALKKESRHENLEDQLPEKLLLWNIFSMLFYTSETLFHSLIA